MYMYLNPCSSDPKELNETLFDFLFVTTYQGPLVHRINLWPLSPNNLNILSTVNFQELLQQLTIFNVPVILKISIILLLVNLLFKITAAPFNIWAPRIYEGAPLPAVMFLSIFSKIAVIFVIIRLFLVYYYEFLTTWAPIFLLCGLLSMLGAIGGAIAEVKIKRFFVYSSMSHVGLILLALACGNLHGVRAALLYLVIYTITSLGGWTIIMLLINRVNKIKTKKVIYITGLKGLSRNNALLSFFLAIIMFSMGGIPPLAGFFAKFEVLYALTETELFSFAFIALLLSVISFFYYLRIIKVLYFDTVKNYKVSFKSSQEKGFILALGFLFTIFFVLYLQQPTVHWIFANSTDSLFSNIGTVNDPLDHRGIPTEYEDLLKFNPYIDSHNSIN